MRDLNYLLPSLPGLPMPGEKPPLSFAELREKTHDRPHLRAIVDAVLVEHDLRLRQSRLAGEVSGAQAAVLTENQARGEERLPDELAGEEQAERTFAAEAMWEVYFRFLTRKAKRLRCPFLAHWAAFEVGLRNALANERARRLGLSAERRIVAEEVADDADPVGTIVSNWATAANPLAAERALEQGRWDWLAHNARWYSFAGDELAAYAVGLLLLQRRYAPDETARAKAATLMGD